MKEELLSAFSEFRSAIDDRDGKRVCLASRVALMSCVNAALIPNGIWDLEMAAQAEKLFDEALDVLKDIDQDGPYQKNVKERREALRQYVPRAKKKSA